ncbi:hypothetical protein [Streptomyces sp. NBC_01716]|uniref:hypothetical protein n=1 Tax=Streptomyces sp. NBC_01716 TaxID=2975917 RepID=UPI002E2F3C85|nr:hypothetical protein [Streptomyces sp. NBC_01716]
MGPRETHRPAKREVAYFGDLMDAPFLALPESAGLPPAQLALAWRADDHRPLVRAHVEAARSTRPAA